MANYPAIENFWLENHKRPQRPTDFRALAYPIAILAAISLSFVIYSILGRLLGSGVLFAFIYLRPWLKTHLKDTSANGLFYKKEGNIHWLLSLSYQSLAQLAELDLQRAKKAANKIDEAIKQRVVDLKELENKGFREDVRLKQLQNTKSCYLELNRIFEALEEADNELTRVRDAQKKVEEDFKRDSTQQRIHNQQQRKLLNEELATLNLAKKSGLLDSEEYNKQKDELKERLSLIHNGTNEDQKIHDQNKSVETDGLETFQNQGIEAKDELETLNLANKAGLLDSDEYEKQKKDLMQQFIQNRD